MDVFTVVGVLAVILGIISQSGYTDGCVFGPGSDCAMPCHCWDGASCDSKTGKCSNGRCAGGEPFSSSGIYNWGGPSCQIGNVARGKSTNQTGIWGRLASERAVDGRVDTQSQRYCAHPLNSNITQAATWWVDLNDTYRIYNVTVFNTYESTGSERMKNLSVSVASDNDATVCGIYRGVVPKYEGYGKNGNMTIHCPQPTFGKYVKIQRMGSINVNLITLCEVVVIGHKYIDCSYCPNNCSDVLGCMHCPPGKTGLPLCDQNCLRNQYGDGCKGICRCANGSACNSKTGVCPSGACEKWFFGKACNVDIKIINWKDQKIEVLDTTSSTARIRWDLDPDVPEGGSRFYGYAVEYRPSLNLNDGYRVGIFMQHSTVHLSLTATIEHLSANTEYDIKVTGFRQWPQFSTNASSNGRDEGWPSDIIKIRTMSQSVTTTSRTTIKPTQPSTITSSTTITTIIPTNIPPSPPIMTPSPPAVGTTTNSNALTSSTSSSIQTSTNTKSQPGESVVKDKPGRVDTGLVVGVVIALLVVTAIIVVIVVMRMRGWPKAAAACIKKKKPTERPLIEIQPDGAFVVAAGETNRGYDPDPVAVDMEPVVSTILPVQDLGSLVHQLKTASTLKEQYNKLPREDRKKCKSGEKAENKPKNRFVNILAYDTTRVKLDVVDGDKNSDYINGSFIEGYPNEDKAYIATQGPKPVTIVDFWRMIWLLKSNRIVMVAKLVENMKTKCEVYWPTGVGRAQTYGDITVTMVAMESYADYCMRVLVASCGDQKMEVRQFHFNSWPDKQKPEHAFHVLAFRRKVRHFDSSATGPMVVHCSAGVGRTGTFISIDAQIDKGLAEGQIDPFNYVSKLRIARMNMVQTLDQYIFIHEALAEAFESGETAIPCSEFSEHFAGLCQVAEDDLEEEEPLTQLQTQFELVVKLKPKLNTDHMSGRNKHNTFRNRDMKTIPHDKLRPYLMTRYDNGSDYINAVFLDSYKMACTYVATQWPLPRTVVDFWRLVHDHNCRTIVLLANPETEEKKEDKEEVPVYWPTQSEPRMRHGPMEVNLLSEEPSSNPNIIVREFRVCTINENNNKSAVSSEMGDDDEDRGSGVDLDLDEDENVSQGVIVRQYHLKSWPSGDVLPQNTTDMLDLMEQMQKWQQQLPALGINRVAVQCIDGVERSGMFCTAHFVLDKMKVDQEVDVFLAARYITSKRPETLESYEQYEFIHLMAKDYMSRYETYANFQ